mmetsp:Transcript_25542/g.19316  ORF Transcript_25542/g.19316 Transcript_25542/m.19316 type:complete len:147 (+) Transcript_25542:223-663(+)
MESSLAAPNGFMDVDIYTLRHKRFGNVFGIGDCTNLPTAKTAAGVFSQAPVVVHNLLDVMEAGEKARLKGKYDGYNSCPLFTGDKKLMLIEFKYDGLPAETFTNNQTTPTRLFYYMKKELFPVAYFEFAARGMWFGRKGLIKPSFF